ncbi:MAG: hypothetical protein ACLPN2_07390, partial [Terriglobales bacterium]
MHDAQLRCCDGYNGTVGSKTPGPAGTLNNNGVTVTAPGPQSQAVSASSALEDYRRPLAVDT